MQRRHRCLEHPSTQLCGWPGHVPAGRQVSALAVLSPARSHLEKLLCGFQPGFATCFSSPVPLLLSSLRPSWLLS